jgi:hypothetical protein
MTGCSALWSKGNAGSVMGGDEMAVEFIDAPVDGVDGCDRIPHYGGALLPAIGSHYLET